MKNPYHDQTPADSVLVSRPVALTGMVLFLLFLTLVPLAGVRDLVAVNLGGDEKLREKLRRFETAFSEMSLFSKWREVDQEILVRGFGEGNRRVWIGEEGWLYYRPDLETVVGKGGDYVEPPSVARAPGLSPWQQPLPVIRDFAKQLQEQGIRLILVPVPTKAMVHPEGLGVDLEKALPFEYEKTKKEIEGMGVDFVDLLDLKGNWLKQDTHWTPEAMKEAAQRVAAVLEASGKTWSGHQVDELARANHGDLVGMLGGEGIEKLFRPEKVMLEQVRTAGEGELLASDPQSGVVLLGDSFVNIFEDVSLGFSADGEDRIGAGFASHLAAESGQSLAVIASNGGGASAVRKRFAEALAKRARPPRAVVWVLSARDLFLSEIPGRRARIEWEFVDLPETSGKTGKISDSAEMILTATLREKSRIGDEAEQRSAAYESAIYSAIFDEVEVEEGSYEVQEAWVFLWAAQKRKLMESAKLEPGRRYRLRLIPFPNDGPVSTATQLDDFFRVDLDRYFAVEATAVEE